MATMIDAPPGLEGVVVADTAIGDVRGEEGFFHYRGYPAPMLARTQPLEAVWYLVQRGHLPDHAELRAFAEEAAVHRRLDARLLDALPSLAREGTVMSAVRTALSLAGQSASPWLDLSPNARAREAMRLSAVMPSLVAAVWRVRNGQAPVTSQPGLSVASDYLEMIAGASPSVAAEKAVERYLLLTIDHGFNASTFATRVVTSTGADLTAAAVAGIAALSGPLHGGAPSRVVDMLKEIGTVDRARPWIERALAAGERIMGFGHRVYRTEDPRSAALKETALALGGPVVELAVEVERVALEILDRKYPERRLRTNVEFYAGVVLHEIGLPSELFSPTFAVSRMIGWMAHALEQMQGNRIVRPASRYVGPLYCV
jgi:citrate synthase